MDHVANMLTSIKNGGQAKKELVHVPYSQFKASIANLLFSKGFIKSYAKKDRKTGPVLEIGIHYVNGKPRVNDAQRVSKLSRRLYMGVKDLKPVRQGHGSLVLSTPKGILTDEDARKEQVGGEALFKIW